MNNTVDLSAVITVHNEGLIAHKTMRSVLEALKRVEQAGHTYEVIVHIDNGDRETINYFERYKGRPEFRIFRNNFGDTGPSRNYATEKANGKYVAFMDGDDLVSDNWYLKALEILENSVEETIVHPEGILTFGISQQNVLTLQEDSYGVERDTKILLGENRWCATLVAKKETLQKIPYAKLGDGYGHEDYVLNILTMEKGIVHKVAKNTILFYRRTEHSRLSSSNSDHAIIPYMKAFDFELVKKYRTKMEVQDKKITLKNRGYKIYKKIRNNDTLNYFITPIAKVTLKVLNRDKRGAVVPKWVIDEWIRINHIDSQLYPFKHVLSNVAHYSAEEHIGIGEAYVKIAKSINGKTNYVFLVPWVVRGGADKVLFNYIEALRREHLDWRFTVIATLPAKNAWANTLPEYVDFVDFGNVAFGLTPEEQDQLMSRVLTQLKCKRLHIINSEFGYDWVRRHLELVKRRYVLNVSLFAYEYIAGSDMRAVYSYDNPCLFEIFSVVQNVFTDNAEVIKYTIDENGFDDSKFKVHYQPVRKMEMCAPKRTLINEGRLRILWAGRVVPVKLPELVAEIGKRLDPNKVKIDVFGEINKDTNSNVFDNVAAISYNGAYDGFSSLPTDNYDLLLYTSLTDGMPNVILEAAAAGLPIIASDDGGVGEFVKNKKTGILIKDYTKPEPYVEAINEVLRNPECLKEYADNAQELLRKQHSFEKFVEIVNRDID